MTHAQAIKLSDNNANWGNTVGNRYKAIQGSKGNALNMR